MNAPCLPLKLVHHISLTTRDAEASRAFYRTVLGFREIPRPDFNFRGAWLYHVGVQIHIIQDGPGPEAAGPISSRADHVAFEVDDLDAAERILRQHGVEYRVNIQAGTGLKQLFFRDPDGHHIELATYGPTRLGD